MSLIDKKRFFNHIIQIKYGSIMNRKIYIAISVLFLNTSCLLANSLDNKPLITIHGFTGAAWNMYYIAHPLEKAGMDVTHWDYPSRDKTIQEHAEDLVVLLNAKATKTPGQPIHFLTHSMGGLVLRAAVNHPECPLEAKIGKAVLLAPPNQGTYWGRFIKKFYLVRYIAKDKSGHELMTELDFEHLGSFPDTMQVMVIAGNFGFNPFIPTENDGEVTVEETFLKTPHHHVTLYAGHKSIIFSKKAANFAKGFFQENSEL
jgi:pimeloyl-ACP methyl ester carboxylesterase